MPVTAPNAPTDYLDDVSGATPAQGQWWGYDCLIDASGCDAEMNNEQDVTRFIADLVKALKMKPLGLLELVRVKGNQAVLYHFDGDKQVSVSKLPSIKDLGRGISAVQIITTSTITFHGDDKGDKIFLDVFSCAPYEPQTAVNLFTKRFKPKRFGTRWILRDARSQQEAQPTSVGMEDVTQPVLLMAPPFTLSNEEPNNPLMSKEDAPVNRSKAFDQWFGLYQELSKQAMVYLLPCEGDFQDRPYVANIGAAIGNTFLVSTFKSPPRQGEEWAAESLLSKLGFTTRNAPYYFEGEADLKWQRDNLYIGGYGIRTDKRTYDSLSDLDIEVVPVKMTDEKCYHFDCLYFPLDANRALVSTGALGAKDLRAIEKHVEVIPVPEKMRYKGWTNSVRLGNRIFTAEKTFVAQIDKLGFEPVFVDLKEFDKSGADLSCLVCHLNHNQRKAPLANQRLLTNQYTLNETSGSFVLGDSMETYKFTLNGTTLRRETMDGKEYLVAPMAMLTEGVHAGSNGPLFYPKTELAKTPVVWNHKPLVVYHPISNGVGVTACSPEVIETRGVGVIMNAVFDGKLRAEAWIDEPKLKRVDNRVLEALNKGEMVEVSTGLFTDNEQVEGEWDGPNGKEKYTAIARNYRPDHLAILPDKKGACSIKDGAGLLQLNDACIDLLGGVEHQDLSEAEHQEVLTYNRDWPQEKRDKLAAADFAGPNQTFPIKTQADVKAAASLAHHAKDPAAVKRRILAICKRKGLKPPAAWAEKTTTNASHSQIHQSLQQAVQKYSKTVHGTKNANNFVSDVYDDFFIYGTDTGDGSETQYYHQGYETDPDKKGWAAVKLKGVPTPVKRVTQWQDAQGNVLANEVVVDRKAETRLRYIEELKLNGYDTAAEVEMLRRMPLERLAYLVQNTWSQAAWNKGANFVAQDSAAPTGGTGATSPSTAPAGGTPTPGEKQFGLRKATGKGKKRKPMNGLVPGAPGATAKY